MTILEIFGFVATVATFCVGTIVAIIDGIR